MKAHLAKWLAHYAGVLAGVCAILAGMDLSPLGHFGTVLAGAASTGIILAHALGVQPAKVVSIIAPLALAVLAGLGLQSCATAPATVSNATGLVTSQAAQPYIQAAALAAVTTAEQKGVSAAEITSIAQQALAADQGAGATLGAVALVVNAQLAKLNLPAGDIEAAEILEDSINIAITAKIGTNATLAQLQAAVADILNAIILAANGGIMPSTPASSSAPIADVQTVEPPADAPVAHSSAIAAIESPEAVGAATSTLVVWALGQFAHVNVSAPVAAAGAVLWTLGAVYLQL